MFREIREIKGEERISNNKKLGYMNIKPEKEMSDKEIDDFIMDEFRKLGWDL